MKKEFITSYLTFYMKATVELAGDFIKVANPNSILKVIPLGVRNKSIPVNQVSSVDESFKLDLKSFIWGIIFILIGLSSFKSSLFAGVLITIYGAITVLSSFQTIMSLQLTSGGSYDISVVVFEKENNKKLIVTVGRSFFCRLFGFVTIPKLPWAVFLVM